MPECKLSILCIIFPPTEYWPQSPVSYRSAVRHPKKVIGSLHVHGTEDRGHESITRLRQAQQMPISFQPMPLARKARPFNHPEWLFELKYDGFRALARIERGRAELISRNGHPFASFSNLADSMRDSVPANDIVLDGEIVCLDRKGRPQFNDLLFRRGRPCFFAFDPLYSDGKDWRGDGLADRKAALRSLLQKLPMESRLRYADHVEGSGMDLFERC